MSARASLPNRRETLTETIAVGSAVFEAAVGFDPQAGRPREIFLSGARSGADMEAILADASIVISIALQHGIPAGSLRHSICRLPPEYGGGAASVIGAALDLLAGYEADEVVTAEAAE